MLWLTLYVIESQKCASKPTPAARTAPPAPIHAARTIRLDPSFCPAERGRSSVSGIAIPRSLIFENVDASHTRITASTQYVVRKDFEFLMTGATIPGRSSDSISFTSGGSAVFPNSQTTCAATGALESQLLSLVRE